jgi:hypothetical protein
MQVATQHDCGFELIQVRTGAARSTAYLSGTDRPVVGSDEAVREEIRTVLEITKHGRGFQQRLNMKALGKVVRRSIEKGGSGDMALERFGKAIGL